MRIVLVFTLACCSMTTAGWGQQSTPEVKVKDLLVKFRSSEEQERVTAFAALRSDPANLKNPEVRAELENLLDRENRYLDRQLEEAENNGYPAQGTMKDGPNTIATFSALSIHLPAGTKRDRPAFWRMRPTTTIRNLQQRLLAIQRSRCRVF